ncbi:MAG: hypothetical protein ABJZ55_16080 [Fuerstiella sp.]
MSEIASPLHFCSEVGTSEEVTVHAIAELTEGIGTAQLGSTFKIGPVTESRTDVSAELIVQLPNQFGDNIQGESHVVSGQVLFPESAKILADERNSMTIRGELFQIRSVGTVIDGFVAAQVTRRRHETRTASSSLGGL